MARWVPNGQKLAYFVGPFVLNRVSDGVHAKAHIACHSQPQFERRAGVESQLALDLVVRAVTNAR